MMPLSKLHNILNIALLCVLFGLVFNGIRPAPKVERWASCYDQSKNSLHFQRLLRRTKSGDSCIGKTQFKMPRGWKLVENASSDNLFGELRAGTKKSIMLTGGRRIMAAQWEKPNNRNLITILEPRLGQSKVKRHCVIPNYGEAFSVRFDKTSRKLAVLVKNRSHKSEWKHCKI